MTLEVPYTSEESGPACPPTGHTIDKRPNGIIDRLR